MQYVSYLSTKKKTKQFILMPAKLKGVYYLSVSDTLTTDVFLILWVCLICKYITYLISNWQFDYLNVLYQLDQVQGANSCHRLMWFTS